MIKTAVDVKEQAPERPQRAARQPVSTPVVVAAIVLVYLVAALSSALTQQPWCDEAWNSSPALSLITRGFMGTPVLETAGTWLTGIDRYTYWIMPLHPLGQAAWYEIFGFGVLPMRVYSMFWGVVAMGAWFVIMRRISADRWLPVLVIALLGTDFIFVQRSSEGRMDIMCAALGFAGLAVYLTLRERNLRMAVLAANSLVAASCFTHPNGIMPFLGLMFLIVYLDWRRVRFSHVALAVTPYVVGLVGWGLYISKAPEFFLIQYRGNASGRFAGLLSPWTALKTEIGGRYVRFLAGFAPDLSTLHRLKALVLIAYVVALAGVLAVRSLRREYRIILVLTAIYFAVMTLWDGMKSPLYLIHIVPFYTAILAVWIRWCWQTRVIPRAAVVLAVAALVVVQLGGAAYVVRRNNYNNAFRPAVAFVKAHSDARTKIMGSSELGFELGFFSGNVIDDVQLGYASHTVPDLIVVEKRYQEWFNRFRTIDPPVHQFLVERLTRDYRPVYNHAGYTIYAPRERSTSSGG